MNRKQKEALAFEVLKQIADLPLIFSENGMPPELDGVSLDEISAQLALWAKKLPGTAWDNRLPYTK